MPPTPLKGSVAPWEWLGECGEETGACAYENAVPQNISFELGLGRYLFYLLCSGGCLKIIPKCTLVPSEHAFWAPTWHLLGSFLVPIGHTVGLFGHPWAPFGTLQISGTPFAHFFSNFGVPRGYPWVLQRNPMRAPKSSGWPKMGPICDLDGPKCDPLTYFWNFSGNKSTKI